MSYRRDSGKRYWARGYRTEFETGLWWPSYKAYLASPTWADKRRRALERDEGLCECGETATEVHHTSYHYRWGEEPLYVLVSLCNACHAKRHGKDEKPAMQIIRSRR